jgi:DNA polymerase-1
VKLAMLSVHRALVNRTGARLLLQVHDELLLECPEGEARGRDRARAPRDAGLLSLNVPLTVSVGTGRTWFDVH